MVHIVNPFHDNATVSGLLQRLGQRLGVQRASQDSSRQWLSKFPKPPVIVAPSTQGAFSGVVAELIGGGKVLFSVEEHRKLQAQKLEARVLELAGEVSVTSGDTLERIAERTFEVVDGSLSTVPGLEPGMTQIMYGVEPEELFLKVLEKVEQQRKVKIST